MCNVPILVGCIVLAIQIDHWLNPGRILQSTNEFACKTEWVWIMDEKAPVKKGFSPEGFTIKLCLTDLFGTTVECWWDAWRPITLFPSMRGDLPAEVVNQLAWEPLEIASLVSASCGRRWACCACLIGDCSCPGDPAAMHALKVEQSLFLPSCLGAV